ncbi:hypothetical protein ACQP00_20815 [Dactylosporangium sp. CS-047395]|uniref:hypothetical protein n=1 Tax=Dactylosporangium sp. CS-047395 TaxID=3239936 RepID=UPI003D92E509
MNPAWWWRWTAVTTAGELAGFVVPATVGAAAATTARWPDGVTYPAVLAAGFVEGSLLGYAQASVWRSRLPGLGLRRYWTATGAAAVLAYAVGMLPSTLGERLTRLPTPVLVAAGLVAATMLLGSICTAQWLVLCRAGVDRPAWIAATAAAWAAGLAVLLLTAMPLWQPGQAWWLITVIGVGCGALMAATVAALTGRAAVRLTVHLEAARDISPVRDVTTGSAAGTRRGRS